MRKLMLVLVGVLLGAGCMSGGAEEAGVQNQDEGTATLQPEALCHKVCMKRCRPTLTGVRCQNECWTECR